MFKKAMSIVSVVIGIVIVALGIAITSEKPDNFMLEDNYYRYDAQEYDLDYASFGADFYTYIYGSTDMIVDQLSDINKAFETIVKAQNASIEALSVNVSALNSLISTTSKTNGLVMIAIGLAVLAYALNALSTAFSPNTLKKADWAETQQISETNG